MAKSSLEQALEELKAERDRIDSAIETLEGVIGSVGGATKAKRGPRVAKGTRKKAGAKRGAKRQPRGAMKAKLYEILGAAKKPLAVSEVRDRFIADGYPYSTPQVLYTAIFNSAKTDPGVIKTSKGLRLRAGASAEPRKSGPKKKAATKKKAGRRKKAKRRG